MRISELAALSRSNLHEVAGRLLLGPPKTLAAVRDIALPPFLVDGLERLLNSHPYDTVFCTPTGR